MEKDISLTPMELLRSFPNFLTSFLDGTYPYGTMKNRFLPLRLSYLL